MAYTKTSWVDDSAPYLNATNLNKIETGIDEAHDDIAALNTSLGEFIVVSGADPTGSSSSVTAFQDAVDSTDDAGVVTIYVPAGTYLGDMSSLSLGTRVVKWAHLGKVSYSTAEPIGLLDNYSYNGDITRPAVVGSALYGDDTTDGGSSDRPVVRIQRDANHSGGTPGGSVNASVLSVAANVNQSAGTVDNYENAIIGAVYCYRNSTTGESPNFTAVQGVTFKNNNSLGGFFGSNFVARDQSGNESSVSKGGLVGCEIDVVASGPDDQNTRIGLDVIGRAYTTHASAASVFAGIRVRPANSSVAGGGSVAMNLENGLVIDPGSLGSITIGQWIKDCQQYGLYIGAWDVQGGFDHINVRSETSTGSIGIGTQSNTVSATAGQILFQARDSDDAAVVNYGSIYLSIADNTAGAVDGSVTISPQSSGSPLAAFQIRGASPTNPVFMMVGGSLEQVTAGVADSGGTGYKLLRVPN